MVSDTFPPSDEAAQAFRDLIAVVKRLRTPGTGCPWDLEQDHRSLRPFIIEEAYEVLDAMDRGDDRAFREELGDLLLQVVLHAQVADDRAAFSITEVIRGIERKMVRRHPHVFGDLAVGGSAEVVKNWDQIKAAEAKEKGEDPAPVAALARLPEAMPALARSQRLGEKAAKLGFAASSLREIIDRLHAGLMHLETEAASDSSGAASLPAPRQVPDDQRARLEESLGDALFDLCQLARQIGLSAEDSLRACNKRFVERFR